MIYVVPSAVSLRSTNVSLVRSLDSSTLHSKGTTVLQELAGHDGGPRASFNTFSWSPSWVGLCLITNICAILSRVWREPARLWRTRPSCREPEPSKGAANKPFV
jgi:hypothetical protein